MFRQITLQGLALISLLSAAGTLPAQTRTLASSYDLAATNLAGQGTDRWAIASSEVNSHFGKIVRSADINGDGISDLIVSSDHTVKVWLGSTTAPRQLHATHPDVTLTEGSTIHDIKTGDINGDGRQDILVHQSYTDAPQPTRAYATVFLGQTAGYPYTRSLRESPSPSSQIVIFKMHNPEGWLIDGTVELADVNGDGCADLLFGSPQFGIYSTVHLVFGRTDFPSVVSPEQEQVSGFKALVTFNWADPAACA